MKKAEKKEFKVKKLVLSKETLRILSGEDLQGVVGGLSAVCATQDSHDDSGCGTRYTCSCAHDTSCHCH